MIWLFFIQDSYMFLISFKQSGNSSQPTGMMVAWLIYHSSQTGRKQK